MAIQLGSLLITCIMARCAVSFLSNTAFRSRNRTFRSPRSMANFSMVSRLVMVKLLKNCGNLYMVSCIQHPFGCSEASGLTTPWDAYSHILWNRRPNDGQAACAMVFVSFTHESPKNLCTRAPVRLQVLCISSTPGSFLPLLYC